MDAIKAILTRRSIRTYQKTPLTEEILTTLLKAAMSAPSAGNEQPWHFIIITDTKTINKIPSFHTHAAMLKNTPTALLICGDTHLDKHAGMWIQDCAGSTENILIAAQALHLGSVWLGVFPREERITGLRNLLNIPDHIIPFALVAIGYPAEEKPAANRYNKERIHYNTW